MRRRPPPPAGFSLVEVLVVIAIVAVLASVVTLGFAGDNPARRVEEEARRMTLLLELARDEAQLRGEEWGLDFNNDQWGFMRFDNSTRTWQTVDEAPFQRRFAEGVRLFRGGDRRAVATLRQEDPARSLRGGAALPEVFLFSSGEISQFALELTDDQQRSVWRLSSDGLQPVERTQVDGSGR